MMGMPSYQDRPMAAALSLMSIERLSPLLNGVAIRLPVKGAIPVTLFTSTVVRSSSLNVDQGFRSSGIER